MAWIVRWELHREGALSAEERATVESALEGTVVAQEGGRVAHGSASMPYDRSHERWTALLAALTAVRAALPGVRCAVTDDMGLVGWNTEKARYDLERGSVRGGAKAEPERRAAPAPSPSTSTSMAKGIFDDEEEVPAAAPAMPAAGGTAADEEIRAKIDQILASRGSYDLRRSLENSHDPLAIARIAIEKLPAIGEERYDLTAVIRDALGKVDDLEPLRDSITAVWHQKPDDPRWLKDVSNALESAASSPLVVALAIRTLDEARDREPAKIEGPARLLGRARGRVADQALAAIVARMRRDRDKLTRDASWRGELVYALRDLKQPDAFPTLLLEGVSEDPPGWSRIVEAMVASDAARAIALAPRLMHLPEVSGELAGALGDVRTDESTALLRQLASHPLARVRCRAARRLLARGTGELPLVAAIWASLDERAAPDDIDRYDRDDALAALGLEKGAATPGWNERIAAMGMTPVELAPLPTAYENLTHIDADVRRRALRALDETPKLENLLPVALVAEVHDVLRRRFAVVDDYSGWYRWRDAADAPGWLRSARDGVPQVVRAHASELPQQHLTPALQRILELGAEAFAETLPPPLLKLTEAERAAADEAERALIARRTGAAIETTSASASPSLPDVADLFDAPPPDSQGPVMGTREEAEAERISPDQTGIIPPIQPIGGSELFTIREGKSRLLRYRMDDREIVDFVGLIESRVRHLRFDAIEVILRDGDGGAVDRQRRVYEKHLRPAAWIDHQWRFDDPSIARARTVELRATWRESFRARVAHGAWPSFTPPSSLYVRDPLPISIEPDGDSPAIDVKMTCATRADDYVDLMFLVEVASRRRAVSSAVAAELAVALRNKGGSTLDKRTVSLQLPADGTSAFEEVCLRLAVNQLASARMLDVAVQGARTVTETIATYRLPAGTGGNV